MFGQMEQTAMRWRVATFVGTLLTVGACVQIAGIDDPHPKDAGQDAGQDTSQDTSEDGSQDAGEDAGQDAGPDPVQDLEWATWPMPNPKSTTLPNKASYATVTEMGMDFVKDNVTGLMWQRDIHPVKVNWAEANMRCTNLMAGGYSDWRLPTAIELVSLVDFTIAGPGPAIDTAVFLSAPGELHWTASPLVGSSTDVWVVNFNTGSTTANNVEDICWVRCVR